MAVFRFVLVCCCLVLCAGGNALAQQALTRDMINAHFDQIVDFYTAAKPDMGKIAEFTKKYAADGALFKMTMTSNLSDKVLHIDQTTKEYIASLYDTSKELYNSKAKYTITSVDYDKDGLGALVKYTMLLKGTGRMIDKEKGVIDIDFSSLSSCDERFRLVDDVLKGVGADCKIDAVYQKPVPVK